MSTQTNMRLSDADLERLDRLAKDRGLTRTDLVRRLLIEADNAPTPEPPDRDELLRLLGEQARSGSTRACEYLLKRADKAASDAELAEMLSGVVPGFGTS